MHARDVKKNLRWATKTQRRWTFMRYALLPLYLLMYSLEGLSEGFGDWMETVDLKEIGYWHSDSEELKEEKIQDRVNKERSRSFGIDERKDDV